MPGHAVSADRLTAVSPLALLQQGLARHQAGDIAAAALLYSQLLALQPNHADALHLLGLIDFQSGKKWEALDKIRAAIGHSQADPRYFYNLGTVLMALSKPHEAIHQFRTAIAMDPGNAQAHGNLAAALCDIGERSEAVTHFQEAIRLNPADVDAWSNLSATWADLDRKAEAMACLEQALKLIPEKSSSLNNLGFALMRAGELDQAMSCYARAIEIDPANGKALYNLATLLLANPSPEQPDLCIQCFRGAIEVNPDHPESHSNLLMALQYSSGTTVAELLEQHLEFGRHFESGLIDSWQPHANSRHPSRRLRIGYVSADLHNHAVASFIGPILANHDASNVEIFCYYNNSKRDAVAAELMILADRWTPCLKMSDDELARQIRMDEIDILVDLSGHTGGNRLLTFARKPAPLQASWVGYPGTTGLIAMDYYIADRFYLPPGQLDDQFTEKIIRLPIAGAFEPFRGAPDVGPLPALRNGAITFGSFNQPQKFAEGVVELWCRLLHAVPEARMLVGGMPDESAQAAVLASFERHGVAAQRLVFRKRCPLDDYMPLHHEVDICLDTFPYTGGTTSLHAAWMGVPTLTLAGKTAAGRQGCIIAGHLGLDDFAAVDQADFVERGVRWSRDLEQLAAIRSSMRERFHQSSITQPARITTSLEKAFATMWARYCDGLPAASFDIAA